MPSWDNVVRDFLAQPENAREAWIKGQLQANLTAISALRGNRNVLLYGSAFLQKPQTPGNLVSVFPEDINGVMTSLHGMDCSRGLTLIIHSPGGDIGAAQSMVSYLHSKFSYIETIVPTFAMSAGTMMALGSDRVIMGRQSQLGPIDAQLFYGGRQTSAGAILAQMKTAQTDILRDLRNAHIWAPILQSLGPSLYQEAQYALEYGQSLVTEWLQQRMFHASASPQADAQRVAQYFNATDNHKNHGRRIDRAEASAQGVVVEELEPNQQLQEATLTAYHFMNLMFETSPTVKMFATDGGKLWVKNFVPPSR